MNWIALFASLLAVVLRLAPGPRIVDDAYITFRYARNLVSGVGLVYNPGEWVLGTTTPLYTLILAGLSSIFGSERLPEIAWILNALIDGIGVALLYWLGRRLSNSRLVGLGSALLWAVAPFSVTFAIGGLETSLVITLLIAAFACHQAGRPRWTALLLALGVLTRPDVLIAALLILGSLGVRWLAQSWKARRPQWKQFPLAPAGIFVLTLAPWLVVATLTYGSPLPHSIAAKTVAYHLAPEAALVRLLQHFGTPFHEHLIFTGRWIAPGLILYGTLFAIGGWAAIKQSRQSWTLVLYPWFYAAVYAAANPLIFRWYLSPPLPFYFLGILLGIYTLAQQLGRTPRRLALIGFVGLALAAQVNAWTLTPAGSDRPAPEMAWIELERLYQQVALEYRETPELKNGRLAAGDIGALGWYTDAPILDLVGLVSPQAQAYYPLPDDAYVINYAVSADYVLDEMPSLVVILEAYGRHTLLQNPRFLQTYDLLQTLPNDIYGSEGMLVFGLKGE